MSTSEPARHPAMNFTEDELRIIHRRECIRMSPLSKNCEYPLQYGVVQTYWRGVSGRLGRKRRGQLALTCAGKIFYMVADFGTFELAWPIWLGPLNTFPAGTQDLDTDEKLRALEEHCHALCNIANILS